MVNELKGTETEKNLKLALQGEALAHLKYQFYKSKLIDFNKKYEVLLDEIIHNEKEHGKIWFKLLHDDNIPSNEENLLDAIKGESYEHLTMYPKFADVAEQEGFVEVAELFRKVAIIEGNHSKQFNQIKDEVTDDDFYITDGYWKCLNCGHIFKGDLEVCPVCKHPKKYFIKL